MDGSDSGNLIALNDRSDVVIAQNKSVVSDCFLNARAELVSARAFFSVRCR